LAIYVRGPYVQVSAPENAFKRKTGVFKKKDSRV